MKNKNNNFITIKDIIRYIVTIFYSNDITSFHINNNIYDEVIHIISFILNLPINNLENFIDSKILNIELSKILDIVNYRIKMRIPFSYIINKSYICNHDIYVDRNVILPRSLIAELIKNDLNIISKNPWKNKNLLDMCTGSGYLSILLAKHFPNSQIYASDISLKALNIAKKNIHKYFLQDRIILYKSNLFNSLPKILYDIIICNPPYIDMKHINKLPLEFKYEPLISLNGGCNGMKLIRIILNKANNFLSNNGVIIIEIGNKIMEFEKSFPNIHPKWLETENTNDKVIMIYKNQINSIKN